MSRPVRVFPCFIPVQSDSVGRVEYPLHEAAKRGNIELLQECLQNKVGHLKGSIAVPMYP
jgi:hypothetical protein